MNLKVLIINNLQTLRLVYRVPATSQSTDPEETLAVLEFLATKGILKIPTVVTVTKKRPQLINSWFHVINGCNLDCDYCYILKDGVKMTLKTAEDGLLALCRAVEIHHDEFDGLQIIVAGGEPLTNFRVTKFIFDRSRELAIDKELVRHVGILSNGTIYNRSIAGLLLEHKASVSVSLDGLGRFNQARHFPNGRESVGIILKNLQRMKIDGLDPFILTTITNDNIEGLFELTSYLLEHGYGFRYSFLKDLDQGVDRIHDIDRVISELDRCYDLIENNLPSRPIRDFHRFSDVRWEFPIRRSCGIGSNSIRISHTGQIYLCQTDIGKRPAVGSVTNRDIISAVRSQSVLPELHTCQSVDQYDKCYSCEWRYQCGGGCPLQNHFSSGSVGTSSIYCQLFKHFIPRLIRIAGLQLVQKLEKESQ